MAEFNKEIAVLHELENARKAIRRKHKLLKLNRMEAERGQSETLKPIVQPLEKLVQAKQQKLSVDKQENIFSPSLFKKFVDSMKKESKQPKKEEEDDEEEGKEENEEESGGESGANRTQDISFMSAKGEADDDNDADLTVTEKPTTPSSGSSINSYIRNLQKLQTENLDNVYDVRYVHNKLKIGDKLITFEDNIFTVGDYKYKKTPGLIELIFKLQPDNNLITPGDFTNYMEIINYSNAHRLYYRATQDFRKDENNEKYTIYIKPMIESKVMIKKSGKGLSSPYKIARNTSIDYVYWDDPNELVDRLQLLVAETSAGNPSHHNEIQSIIEELREAQIIY